MTRQGDANNLFMELGLGLARWVRALLRGKDLDYPSVTDVPESFGKHGWFRRGLSNLTNLLYLPLGWFLHYFGWGDELWLIAGRQS